MRSGGDRHLAPVHCTHAVNVDLAAGDVGEQFRRVEAPERLLEASSSVNRPEPPAATPSWPARGNAEGDPLRGCVRASLTGPRAKKEGLLAVQGG